MNLHEYQAKAVLRDYGINTPRGVVIGSAAAPDVTRLLWIAWSARRRSAY